MNSKYDIAAYIWPAYTGDEPRTRIFWPDGIGEWQSVKSAKPKFPGHDWPRRPLWGYVNEADPRIMDMECRVALDHCVNTFIYDWYWYDGRPFLENCLKDGFLKCDASKDMKFYLMWANHDAVSLWDKRTSDSVNTVIWEGGTDFARFKTAMKRVIDKYFTLPNYYRIDDKPVFMIYDVPALANKLGGPVALSDAIGWMRGECMKAGLKGLHLQFTMWSDRATNLSGVDGGKSIPAKEFAGLGFDSLSHYQFVHFTDIDRPYPNVLEDVIKEYNRLDAEFDIPYFPHVSLGWDNNPRFNSMRPGIMTECTPENIEKAFRAAKAYADAHPDQRRLITVNSWNEWTESSYLEPDDLRGYGYLEAIKRVFG